MATTKTKTAKATSAGRSKSRRTSKAAAAAAEALPEDTTPAAAEDMTAAPDVADMAETAGADVTTEAETAEAPESADAAEAAPKPEMFRRNDLISAVADRSPIKRSDTKTVVELVLEELGKALDANEELALKPLGKITVKKTNATGNGANLTVKVKRDADQIQTPGETPLADPETDG
jgi:DNA-binding protein HU-alpha